MYTYKVTQGLRHNGRRVPRILHLDDPMSVHQIVLDILTHFFRGEDEPERKAYALYRKSPAVLTTRFTHSEQGFISDDELIEYVTTILCQMKERISGKSDLQYVNGQRRDTLRLLQ
jgi:hypothetical protein